MYRSRKMTPMTLNRLVIEMICLKNTTVVSDSCGRIKRLMKRGVAINISVK
jgi:hypothetical protein